MATVTLRSPAGRWVLAPTILASAMAFIDSTALNVVLPSLQKNLHATAADLFWILNAYLLMLASLILVGGSLGDRLGRKRVFITGITTFIIGSAACGLAPGTGYLIAFRIVQGLGGALMIPGSLALLSSSIDEQERGKAIGTWSAVTTIVTMSGPILGGALADAGLWRYIFFINVPIGLAALLILWRKVTEPTSPRTALSAHPPAQYPGSHLPSPSPGSQPPSPSSASHRSLDLPGSFTVALGLAALTFGFLRTPALGLTHWSVIGSLIAGVALLATFLFIENKSSSPMMPLKLFSNTTFSGVNLLTFFLYAGLGAGMLFLSLNLVQAQGYSQLDSGMTFLPFTVLMIAIARPAGTLADKWGPRPFLIGGPALAGLGLFLLSLVGHTRGPAGYWTTFFPGILVLGLGMSFTVAPLTATVMRSVSDEHSGTASGINNALTRVAGVFANAIFGAVAVLLFTHALRLQLDPLPLQTSVKQVVFAQAADLGNARVPDGIQPKAAIAAAYRTGFIAVYQRILQLAAALAFVGALFGALLLPGKRSTAAAPSG